MSTFRFIKIRWLFIIACTSINSITVIIIRWSSNSNYAFIGIIRSVAQLISYEVNFILIIMSIINITEQINLNIIYTLQKYVNIGQIMPIMLLLWIITALAETSRTPFDFSEGESELVSGFNIEYRRKSFIFLFLAEYSNILFIRFISRIAFMRSETYPISIIWYIMFCLFFVWTRTTLPRFRYDKLIKFNWTQLMPATTLILIITFVIKMYN